LIIKYLKDSVASVVLALSWEHLRTRFNFSWLSRKKRFCWSRYLKI